MYAPVQIPAGYRIAIESNKETGKRAYFVMKQDALEVKCWREVAGPYTTRGGAVQRLDRMIARPDAK